MGLRMRINRLINKHRVRDDIQLISVNSNRAITVESRDHPYKTMTTHGHRQEYLGYKLLKTNERLQTALVMDLNDGTKHIIRKRKESWWH